MKKYNNYDEISDLINNNQIVIVYFNGVSCGACEVIKVKIEKIIDKYPKIKSCEINGEDHLDVAASFDVFSLPLLLVYIDGKETIRIGKNIDLLEFENIINRYYTLLGL